MIAFNRWHVLLLAAIVFFISLAQIAHQKDYDDAVLGYVSTTVGKVDDKLHVVSAAQALMPQHTVKHTIQHTVTVTTTATAPIVTETRTVEIEKDAPECPDRHALWVDPFVHLNTTINVPKEMVFDPKGPKSSQIAILTASDGNGHNKDIANIIELACENRDEYAAYHGYIHHFINISKYDLVDVPPVWKKLPAIVETFNKFPEVQWLWWLDLDAIIMDPAMSLQDHLLSREGQKKNFELGAELQVMSNDKYKNFFPREPDFENIDFIISQDGASVNAGVFFLRRSQFTQFLIDLWADPLFMYASFSNREQDAMAHLLKHHPSIRQHTGIATQRSINAYTEGPIWMNWQKGDFMVHLAGCWVVDACQERWDKYWNMRGRVGKS